MATHCSVLAWRIPGMAEPGGLPSVGSRRVGHDWSDLAAAAAMEKKDLSAEKKQNPPCFIIPSFDTRRGRSHSNLCICGQKQGKRNAKNHLHKQETFGSACFEGPQGRAGVLQSMGLKRVRHDLVTEQQSVISGKFSPAHALTYWLWVFAKLLKCGNNWTSRNIQIYLSLLIWYCYRLIRASPLFIT